MEVLAVRMTCKNLRGIRDSVLTVLKMLRRLEILLLSGVVTSSIAAAEAPRPRGVGPECSSSAKHAARTTVTDQMHSR